MRALIALVAVAVLLGVVYVGVGLAGQEFFFGVVIPYIAIAVFLIGLVYRVLVWAGAPVPYRIPTTCGQQKTLPWLKQNRLDNPSTFFGVLGRMALEVLLFRSLFRNTRVVLTPAKRLAYLSDKLLWAGALAFHWCFLIIFLRHLRFFTERIPTFVTLVEQLDGFFQVGAAPFSGFMLPGAMLSGLVLLGAVSLLLLRRLWVDQVRYISLPADYFPLFLIIGIAFTGVLMRYLLKVDVISVKELTLGLATFQPKNPEGIGVLFYIHLFLVSVLLAYFPFSKLVHFAGIFLSPTRNLSNNNRMVRHVNPWDYPVKVHSYEAYEDEFREKMIEAGLPVEKMPEQPPEQEAETQQQGEKD